MDYCYRLQPCYGGGNWHHIQLCQFIYETYKRRFGGFQTGCQLNNFGSFNRRHDYIAFCRQIIQ